MRPVMPAAASRWPTFVFTAPTQSAFCFSRPFAKTAPRAPSSIGSPSAVPEPWASIYWMSDGWSFAFASVSRISACCATPFGTVSPLLPPSWFTAEPRTTPRMRSPFA